MLIPHRVPAPSGLRDDVVTAAQPVTIRGLVTPMSKLLSKRIAVEFSRLILMLVSYSRKSGDGRFLVIPSPGFGLDTELVEIGPFIELLVLDDSDLIAILNYRVYSDYKVEYREHRREKWRKVVERTRRGGHCEFAQTATTQ